MAKILKLTFKYKAKAAKVFSAFSDQKLIAKISGVKTTIKNEVGGNYKIGESKCVFR